MRQFLAGDEVVTLFEGQLVVFWIGLFVATLARCGGGGASVDTAFCGFFGFFDGFFGKALKMR